MCRFTMWLDTVESRALASNLEVYRVIREITGIGEGKGAFITISDGIGGLGPWVGLMPNADRLAIDTHPYLAFGGQPNTQPISVPAPDGQMGGIWPGTACTAWLAITTQRYATANRSFPLSRNSNW